MSKPAHKQDDPTKYPGQIKNEVTLGDYIERKTSVEKRLEIQKKKLTFDEWYAQRGWDYGLTIKHRMMDLWDAAQENK
jgi:hypothetical protein